MQVQQDTISAYAAGIRTHRLHETLSNMTNGNGCAAYG